MTRSEIEAWALEDYEKILGETIFVSDLTGYVQGFPVFRLADWLEAHKTTCPGKSWVDKACWLIKKAIKSSEAAVKV